VVDPQCEMACGETPCFVMGVDPGSLQCIAGHCSLGAVCDSSVVTCDEVPPNCARGQVPAIDVEQGCWVHPTVCLDASDCASVTSCDLCHEERHVCVAQEAWVTTYHCVEVPPDCAHDRSCDCLGTNVCVREFDACSDSDDMIHCTCINC